LAVTAALYDLDDFVSLRLRPDDTVTERIEDEPPGWDPAAPFYFLWDGDKLERGEWECLGITARIGRVTDQHLAQLTRLDLPRVDLPDANLFDASVADVLRWARRGRERGRGVA
jgi:hypothetical protein